MEKNEKLDEKSVEYLYRDLEHYSSKYFHFDTKLSNYSSLFFKIYALVFGLSITLYGIFSNNAIIQNISIFDGDINVIEIIVWVLSLTNLIVIVLIFEILNLRRTLSVIAVEVDFILLEINLHLEKSTTYTGDLTLDSSRILIYMINIIWSLSYALVILGVMVLFLGDLVTSTYSYIVYIGLCILHLSMALLLRKFSKKYEIDITISKNASKRIGDQFKKLFYDLVEKDNVLEKATNKQVPKSPESEENNESK
ncbi:hypothetical protein HNP92_001232 [Methanococcus maripaludis]|uniref:Uncharacterized protein n=1 Tax=Methanococcus maripaludis TaxID=39152 RepID=A0A7J9S564_METMI|nr:hypothetical protein [Methanococcus maripaludis]MBB6401927.1 hypothetical protein [Methanococcus maripaludis]